MLIGGVLKSGSKLCIVPCSHQEKHYSMLVKTPTGTWLPAWVPESQGLIAALLLLCAMVESAVSAYPSPVC